MFRSFWFDVTCDLNGECSPISSKSAHLLFLDPPGRVGTMTNVFPTSRDQIFLPSFLRRIATIVWSQTTNTSICGQPPDLYGRRSAHHPADIFHKYYIDQSISDLIFHFFQLWPIEPLPLPFSGNWVEFSGAIIKIRDFGLRVIDLIFKADFLLILAPADARDDQNVKNPTASWFQRNATWHCGLLCGGNNHRSRLAQCDKNDVVSDKRRITVTRVGNYANVAPKSTYDAIPVFTESYDDSIVESPSLRINLLTADAQ
nr:hypothetical protein [Rubinisphaera brasiliensis]